MQIRFHESGPFRAVLSKKNRKVPVSGIFSFFAPHPPANISKKGAIFEKKELISKKKEDFLKKKLIFRKKIGFFEKKN